MAEGKSRCSVVHVINSLDIGGTEMMLLRLLSNLGDDAYRHRVVALLERGALAEQFEALGVPVESLSIRGERNPVSAMLALVRLVRSVRPSIIQGWMYHGNVAASIAAIGAGSLPPVLWNVRHCLYDMKLEKVGTRLAMRVNVWLSRWPRAIIFNSEVARSQHVAFGFRGEQACVVPNGFDIDLFRRDSQAGARMRAALGVPEDALVVGHVARYHPLKDHATFLKAARLVAMQRRDVYFVLVGRGVSADNFELRALCQWDVNKRVVLAGEQTNIPRVMNALDVLCSSSFGEAFSNAIGEAMACQVPCVATDVGESSKIIGDTGLVVQPRDAGALAAALSELLSRSARDMSALGAAARQRIVEHFSMDTVVAAYRRIYKLAASGSRGLYC